MIFAGDWGIPAEKKSDSLFTHPSETKIEKENPNGKFSVYPIGNEYDLKLCKNGAHSSELETVPSSQDDSGLDLKHVNKTPKKGILLDETLYWSHLEMPSMSLEEQKIYEEVIDEKVHSNIRTLEHLDMPPPSESELAEILHILNHDHSATANPSNTCTQDTNISSTQCKPRKKRKQMKSIASNRKRKKC